jgi:hypothetical protein
MGRGRGDRRFKLSRKCLTSRHTEGKNGDSNGCAIDCVVVLCLHETAINGLRSGILEIPTRRI